MSADHDLADRIRGALWGTFVGDALCLGSHWIYNLGEMAQRFGPAGPQGFDAPAEGHYHYPKQSGELTHYGEGALVLLESMAAHGRLDLADYWSRFLEHFGSPEYTGYLDHATKGTLENFAHWEEANPGGRFHFQAGADDDQLAAATRMAPVVIMHRNDPALLDVVEDATRFCQNNDRAVAYNKAAAIALRALLDGQGHVAAFQHARALARGLDPELGGEVWRKLENALHPSLDDTVTMIQRFGQACPLPQSMPSAVICAMRHAHSPAEALMENLRAGGDNAGRGALIGMWLGALHGLDAFPVAWCAKLRAAPRIQIMVDLIVAKAT